jgi:hypothetical protein
MLGQRKTELNGRLETTMERNGDWIWENDENNLQVLGKHVAFLYIAFEASSRIIG